MKQNVKVFIKHGCTFLLARSPGFPGPPDLARPFHPFSSSFRDSCRVSFEETGASSPPEGLNLGEGHPLGLRGEEDGGDEPEGAHGGEDHEGRARAEGLDHGREGEGDDGGEAPVDDQRARGDECPDAVGEDLGDEQPRDGSVADREGGYEEADGEDRYHGQPGRLGRVLVEEVGGQGSQGGEHEARGCDEQYPATKAIRIQIEREEGFKFALIDK